MSISKEEASYLVPVYRISELVIGQEYYFSTGDLIKVIEILPENIVHCSMAGKTKNIEFSENLFKQIPADLINKKNSSKSKKKGKTERKSEDVLDLPSWKRRGGITGRSTRK